MFCSQCGNEIVTQAKFCPVCGQPVSANLNEGINPGDGGGFILTINRANQWFAINPAVKIVVDGNVEYNIENGSTLNIPISAGVHNIAFMYSIRNKIVNINVNSNVTLNIKWNRVTGSLEVE